MIQWPLGERGGDARRVTPSHYEELANLPFDHGYVRRQDAPALLDELFFQRAVQTYLWALPALNMYAMKEGAERAFGAGYQVLSVFKERVNANTLITTPNSDLIYAFGFLDLKRDGPIVIEVPAGMQGVLDDFWQRPIPAVGVIDGRRWRGEVGRSGPDRGKGGAYLILPPDYVGRIPAGYYVYRSGTYGVFVFWRAYFASANNLAEPVRLIERTRIYPLGTRPRGVQMEFPNASVVPANMLYPQDGTAFGMLARFIDGEYADPADREMRGMAAAIGIAKGQPFLPDLRASLLLDRAARTATRIGHVIAYSPSTLSPARRSYPDRQYVDAFPANATFSSESINYLDARTGFFTYAYSSSPAMPMNMETVGGIYPSVFTDANGDFLSGDREYGLHLPANIPAAKFWSVTVYDALTGSGLDNGQPFPSLNTMDHPLQNADGSTDIYFGATPPGRGKNWLATVPGKGWFAIIRLYEPQRAFFDQSWMPDDIVRLD
ncbi:MAG: DUF1254 domain-containing protein [Gemmatimonadetes bacterium]|nr:MAG: DUF1254 domain-containing protein [Gemmatimonadota bacterium]